MKTKDQSELIKRLELENESLRQINSDQKELIEKLEIQNERLRKSCEINTRKIYKIGNAVFDLYHNVWDKNMDRAEETKEQFLKIIDQADPDVCMSTFFKI